MAIANWKPSTIYLPGALVVPTTQPGATATTITNADFESGDADWTKGAGWAINTNDAFAGTYSAEYSGPGVANLISANKVSVAPGKAITAKCLVQHGASAAGQAQAAIMLQWYDGVDAPLAPSIGNYVSDGAAGIWKESTVSGTAPAGAASVSVGITGNNDWTPLWVDNFQWNYVQGVAAAAVVYKSVGVTSGALTDVAFTDSDPNDTIVRSSGSWQVDGFKVGDIISVSGSAGNAGPYTIHQITALTIWLTEGTSTLVTEGAGPSVTITAKATQGTSGSIEPTWPGSGNRVEDNDVTWEGIDAETVTWEASSVLTSGGSEPTWPEEAGGFVSDNNIAWETIPLRIEDENCPHTKVVAIAASKVFAGDDDIVRFCATLNARDWTTQDDAGFLPTGLQQKGQVGVDAMGVYRGNLAVWSPSTFQVWQVDPDPAAMALLDAMEGIGSIHQQAVQPVSNDLFFLAALGVRTVSIAAGSNSLGTGDAGVPIDVLVQAEVQPDVEPIATYYPSAGQYWLAFRTLTVPILAAGTFLLTSTIYPIESIEAFEGNFGITDSRLQVSPITKEGYTAGFEILGATLRTAIKSTDMNPEGYTAGFDIIEGGLEKQLLDTTMKPEGYDTGFSASGGFLDRKLVENTYEDEGFDTGFTILSGGLQAQ